MVLGAPTKEMRTRQVLYAVQRSAMDPVHIPVPNSCNCDVVPNERANTASTLIASTCPVVINDMGLFERIFFLATALVRISSHRHRQTRIYAHYTPSNSQMCISVIETRRSPVHGLVPFLSAVFFAPPCSLGTPAVRQRREPAEGCRPSASRGANPLAWRGGAR
jgi:hypothetical protein